jgi:hypothetical protein
MDELRLDSIPQKVAAYRTWGELRHLYVIAAKIVRQLWQKFFDLVHVDVSDHDYADVVAGWSKHY